jgi:hypothetical protein
LADGEGHHHHHHNEHNQDLGLKTCSFKAQGVLGVILVLVFPYSAVPKVGTGKPVSVGGFCPFVPGGLTISFDTILSYLPCRGERACVSVILRAMSAGPQAPGRTKQYKVGLE